MARTKTELGKLLDAMDKATDARSVGALTATILGGIIARLPDTVDDLAEKPQRMVHARTEQTLFQPGEVVDYVVRGVVCSQPNTRGTFSLVADWHDNGNPYPRTVSETRCSKAHESAAVSSTVQRVAKGVTRSGNQDLGPCRLEGTD